MADNSKIEWTEATWNPIRGCSVVSEGCRNCYAMSVAARFSGKGYAYEGLAYRNESGAHWTGKVRLIEEHLQDPLRWQRPRLIFVNSMSDLFHEDIPDDWIVDIFRIMETARQHKFQILTKRPLRMLDFVSRRHANNPHRCPASNVWLGVSCEDQKTADERIPLLLQTPAAVRWLSAEPLLGPIDLPRAGLEIRIPDLDGPDLSNLNWVVAGGESGSDARPMHPHWARSLRDQCVAAGVPFFFKQWGRWVHSWGCDDPCGACVFALADGTFTGNDWVTGPHLGHGFQMHPVSKKEAGRELDGRTWDEFPKMGFFA